MSVELHVMWMPLLLVLLPTALVQSNPIDNDCPNCSLEKAMAARKEQIKRDLLDRLGLDAPPNISISRDMPHFLHDSFPLFGINGTMMSDQPSSYNSLVAVTPEYRRSTTELIVTFARQDGIWAFGFTILITNSAPECNNGLSVFNYTSTDYQMYVNKATLRVYINPVSENTDYKMHKPLLSVYGVDKNGNKNSRRTTDVKLGHKLLADGGWVTIGGLQHSLNQWFSQQRNSQNKAPYAVHVECIVNGEDIVAHTEDTENEHTMYMSIEVESQRSDRTKRSAEPNDICDPNLPMSERGCCRERLRIEFSEFGWDWIIAPKFYDAYMCAGSCSTANTYSIHGHLTNQKKHELRHHGHHRAAPCCHPTEYSKLKIVFMKEKGTVEVSTVEGMIAQRCGCA